MQARQFSIPQASAQSLLSEAYRVISEQYRQHSLSELEYVKARLL
ncbi:MAG: hypothetical protein OFPII_15730 [Osedax symbiont Rs1]|nr:MAG: hypothetical protein OFPII_15730 [Osedax symbiont Rs1]